MRDNIFELKTLLPLDIQFFAEGDEPVSAPEPVEFESAGIVSISDSSEPVVRGYYNPDAEIEYPSVQNPLLETPSIPEQPQFEPVQEEVQQPEETLVQPQQPTLTPQQQYLQELALQNQTLSAQLQQMMANQMQNIVQQPMQQPIQQAPQEPQLTEEQRNEQLMEKFYENPSQFFNELKQQAIEEARRDFEPIIQERQIAQEVDSLTQKYGDDFLSAVPTMQNLVNQLGDQEVERIGLENVYLMAKGVSAQNQPVQPQLTPEQILADPQFINDYLAKNPTVQEAVLSQYMSSKQQTQPPKVMGNVSGAAPSLAPQERPKSISEASKLLRKSWGI